MQVTHVLAIVGVLTSGAAQTAPPAAPPLEVQTPVQAPPPAQPLTQLPAPAEPPKPVPVPPAAPSAAAPPALTASELRQRRDAIIIMESLFVGAVRLAAKDTAGEIRRVDPAITMFSSAPVKAHGTYLEGFGVFFSIEIPSVVPSVASIYRSLSRENQQNAPAQRAGISTGSTPDPVEPLMDPDAHYVDSVKNQLINAMVRQSNSLELHAEEWLVVEARDGSETPGQLTHPSTMTLRIKGSDLAEYFAKRITVDEARKRVQVRPF